MKRILFVAVLITVAFSGSIAQCMLTPIHLSQRIINSTNVIEGKVVDQKCFWDPLHQKIYTSNLVEVYKTFKNTTANYIEVVTYGGIVDDRILIAEPSLKLAIGDEGVFTLNTKELPSQFNKSVFEPYADAQGFIKYDVNENKAIEPLKTYDNLRSDFYTELQKITGLGYTIIKDEQLFTTSSVQKNSSVTAITSFSPTTLTAGTFSVLTIKGSGFGATQGTSFVEFADANKGGASYFKPYQTSYVSWNDTMIRIQVPSKSASPSGCAGTGPIKIDIGGVKTISSNTLIVPYSHNNIYISSAPATLYSFPHISTSSGGYELPLYTSFNANAPAKAAFLRALENWRCHTGINLRSTTTTTVNVEAADYYNVIRFDVGTQLPVGTLARTSIFGNLCGSNPNAKTYIDEIDIVFDDATNWNFGPGLPSSSQLDFETAALHEIGHAHNLWHVIDPLDVMHYAYNDGETKRTLNNNNINAGNAMMAISLAGSICSNPIMVPVNTNNCTLAAPIAAINSNSLACTDESISLTDASSGTVTSWTWSMPGGTPATANTQNTSVSYATSGVKTISLTTTNNLGSSTTTKTITIGTCTGINNLFSENQLLIYPNPGKGLFTVQLNEDQTIHAIDVTNSLGQIIYTKNDIKSSIQTIDLTTISSGIYYLKATTTKGTVLTKLVKE